MSARGFSAARKIKRNKMVTNDAEVFRNLINTLLSDFWVVMLFGLAYFGLKHYRWIKAMGKQGPKKKHTMDDFELVAVVHSAKSIAWGILLVIFSYTIVSLAYFLIPANPFTPDNSSAMTMLGQAFEVSVVTLMVAGYMLIISAGGRWLNLVAKIIATLGVLLVVAASIATYLR